MSPYFAYQREQDALTISLKDDWTFGNAKELDDALRNVQGNGAQQITFQCGGLQNIDLTGAWVLFRKSQEFEAEGRDTSFFGYYHDGKIDAYTLAHASIDYDTGPITIQAWMRNIFDTDYEVHGLYFANDPRDAFTINRSYYQRGEPRVYGVNLSYTF